MSTGDILPDVLAPNLKLVICGSAVGAESARAGSYYAGRNNLFWQILHEIGLTDRVLHTSEYRNLLQYGVGLTDAAKKVSGVDANIKTEDYDAGAFVQKCFSFNPKSSVSMAKRPPQIYVPGSISTIAEQKKSATESTHTRSCQMAPPYS